MADGESTSMPNVVPSAARSLAVAPQLSPFPDARYARRCDLGLVALVHLGLQRLPQHCHLSRPLLRDDQCRRPDQAAAVGDGTSHIYQSALSSPQGVASSKQSTTPPPAGEHSLDGHLACTAMPLPGHAVAGPCHAVPVGHARPRNHLPPLWSWTRGCGIRRGSRQRRRPASAKSPPPRRRRRG